MSRDENGLAEGQTIDPNDKNIKHPKKEDAKARGNNNAKHDPHPEVPYEPDVKDVFPEEYKEHDPNYVIIERRSREKLTYVRGYIKKQVYSIYKVRDKRTGKMISAKVPDSPIKNSLYGSSLLADIIVSKFGWHQTVAIITQRYCSMGFNANEETLNGLIMKLSTSQFLRNLDRVLYLAIIENTYLLNDEVHAKVRTDSAKLTADFIRDCWAWGMLSVNFGLVRYSSEGGSRCYRVAYALLSELDHPIFMQSDAYGCYVNLGKKELITRLGCLQHTARRYKNLEEPIAKKISEMFRGSYHLDHQRIEQAANDALIGKDGHMKTI